MNRFVNLVAILLLFYSGVFAGNPPETSDDITQELMRYVNNINQFNSIYPQEKVYLQFDNTSYYTGETIWFKAFVVNASTLNSTRSKVLYVDLISPDGTLLKQQKLMIENGQADGSFPLLDGSTAQAREKRGVLGYPSGFYEVRAYTNYMQNFSEEAIFSRVFAVYEKPKKDGNYYSESPTINIQKTENFELRPQKEKLHNINCAFYPEGGHLIMGKPCRIAFKVTDNTGFGIDATGVLESSGLSFSTIHDGMGWFSFTPMERSNQVEIKVDGKSHTFTLPQPEQTGFALSVNPCGMDSIELHLDCTPDLSGTTLGMTMTCRGELVKFLSFETDFTPIEIIISMKGIPEGVCRIIIFDKNGNIFASRSLYHRSSDFTSPVLSVTPNKNHYEPFEKINLQFILQDGQDNPLRNSFCLSVRDIRGPGNKLADDLRTSMLLSSDLKGFIENPSWYFDTDQSERDEALDLLMLVQGWERYDWMTMTGQKDFCDKHRLEESLTVNGWIMNSSAKKTLEGIKVLALLAMQTPDERISKKYTCTTDTSGYFGFNLNQEFFGKATFAIHAKARKKRLIGPDARIVFERSITPSIRAFLPQELIFNNHQQITTPTKDKTQEAVDDGLPMVVNVNTGILLNEVDILEKRMYIDYFTFAAYDVNKDVEIELDKGDYTTDLIGYLQQKGYHISTTGQNGQIISYINGYQPFFFVHDTKNIYRDPSNLDIKYINSILVFDRPMYVAEILKQDPLLIKAMQFIPGEVLYRRQLLVDIKLKEGREIPTREEIYEINKRVTQIDGYSIPYSFYSPEYPNGPIPGDVDNRRTLYWNPNVITDKEGKAQVEFYNNSVTTRFNISAAGMTASGVPYTLNQDW